MSEMSARGSAVPDVRRVFVVGCSRSGTSLLQYQLSTRLWLFTLPETAYFLESLSSWHARMGALNRLAAALAGEPVSQVRLERATQTLRTLAQRDGVISLVSASASKAKAAALFVDVMDAEAHRSRSFGWIEKTPRHFEVAHELLHVVSGSSLLYVLRDGRDVVASLIDRARRFPSDFPGQENLSYGISLWNSTVQQGLRLVGQERVLFVSYADVAASSDQTVKSIASFLGVAVREPVERSSRFRLSGERWKDESRLPAEPRPSKRNEVLSPWELNQLEDGLDWEGWRRLSDAPNFLRVD